jgi:fructose-1,6-bisphosphatase I
MACKTISNLVNRAGINALSTPPTYPQEGNSDPTKEENVRIQGLIQYDYRMNSMKRLDQLSTIVLRNALRFTGKLQSVKKAKDEDFLKDWSGGEVHEHQPGVLIASTLDSKYVAYFDPLDGSGNADAAICTGTVFGIFETEEEGGDADGVESDNDSDSDGDGDDDGSDNVVLGGGDGMETDVPAEKTKDVLVNSVLQPGKKLVAAGYCLYSSATILVFTLGDGTHGFTLDPQIDEFVLTHPNIKIPPRGNVYSCNEANSEGWSEDVQSYLHALKSGENETKERYALRYVGSMVGDIHRTLMYGGIFFYPGDSKLYPNGHLQLLYKSAPLSYIVEQAGGMSTNGKVNLLDVRPTRVHERSPCFIGSPEDMNEMKKYIKHDE